jgi:hypothetical protein
MKTMIQKMTKAGNFFKRAINLFLLSGIALLFNGCLPGYVGSEPAYLNATRSESPGNGQVWVDGGWKWDRKAQAYEQQDGYWKKPYIGRKFVPGRWKSTPKGHRWVRGHWAR